MPARWVLGLCLVLVALCTLAPAEGPPSAASARSAGQGGPSDLAMYETIADHVRHGGNYYAVTAQELRAGDYPLRPFVTFRPPLLAIVQATLPHLVTLGLLYALVAAVAATWFARVREACPTGPPRIAAAILLAAGLFTSVQPILFTSHEMWAALLIALSLGIRRPGRWVEPVALATVAMLIRELSAVYVLVMLAAAIIEGYRREAIGWCVSLGVLALALVAHAWAVAQVVTPLDPMSSGWSGMNGFWFFVEAVRHATALDVFPYALAVPAVVAALLGWASRPDPLSLRMSGTIVAYVVLIGAFARLNNFYWGLMVAPVLLLGLVFAPDALRDLFAAALDTRRITVRRVVR